MNSLSLHLQTYCLFFLSYILLFMLLQLSQFSPFCPLLPATRSLNPHTVVHVHGSCIYVLWLLCSLCCTLHPRDCSVTTYLCFLIPSPFSPMAPSPLPSGNYQNILYICDSVSVLFVCLFCFLDSVVDRYIFFAILLFIFLISFKKTL